MFKGLIVEEEVNTGRQWSFDFAKFIAIVGMVLVHTFIYIWDEDGLEQGFQYRLNNIYGGVHPLGLCVLSRRWSHGWCTQSLSQ
ncbi:MAG: hypothetical protein IJ552_08450 [Prevotella sp.]|nr:hypothetical protein [Prevotella sp.]